MITMDFTESDIIPAVETLPEDFSIINDSVLSAEGARIEADELDTIDEEGRERNESGERRRRKESRERRERTDSRERKRSMEMMDGLEDVAGKVVDSVIESAVDRVNSDEFKSFEPEVDFKSEADFKSEVDFKSWDNVMGQEPSVQPVTEEFSMIEADKEEFNDKYISLKDEEGQSSPQLEFDSWSRIIEAPSVEFHSDFQIESQSDIEIESRTTFDSNPTTESYSDDEGVIALEEPTESYSVIALEEEPVYDDQAVEETAYLAPVGFSEVRIERISPDDESLDLHRKHKYKGEERMAEPYMDDMSEAFRRGDSLHFGTIDIVDDESKEEVKPDTPRVALDEDLPQDNTTVEPSVVAEEPPVEPMEAVDPVPEVIFEPMAAVDPVPEVIFEPLEAVDPVESVTDVTSQEPVAPEVMFADVMIERSTVQEGHVDMHWKKDKKKHKYEGEVRAEAYIDEEMKVDDNFEDHESVVVLQNPEDDIPEPQAAPAVMFAEVTVTSSKPDEHPDLHWKKERTKHKYEGEVKCEPIITSEPIISEPAPAVMFADVTITRSAPDAPDSDIHWKKDKKKHKYEGEKKCEPLSKEDLKEAIKDITKDEPGLNMKNLLFHILAVIISTIILTAFYSELDDNLSLPCVISCIVYFSLCVYNDCVSCVSSPAYKIWMFDVFSYIVLPLAIGSSILELSEMYLQPVEAVEEDVFIISSIVSTFLCIVEVVLLKFSVDYKMLPLCVVFPVCSNFFLRRWMAGEEPDILVDI